MKKKRQLLEMERIDKLNYLTSCMDDLANERGDKTSLRLAVPSLSRFVAVAEFCIAGHLEQFRHYLTQSISLRCDSYNSHCSPPCDLERRISLFPSVLDAWTVQAFDCCKLIASGLDAAVNNGLMNLLGFTIKYLTLGDTESARRVFTEYYSADYPANYQPYVRFLAAMLDGFETPPERYLAAIDQAHQREVKLVKSPLYADADAHLCLWGIGLANMARHQGKVAQWTYDSPMIPNALIS